MRLLGRLLLVLLALLVLASFFLPALAAPLAAEVLRRQGLVAEHLDVQLEAFPPQAILLGHVDRARVTASGVVYQDLQAASLVAGVTGLDLLGGSTPRVQATLTEATVGGVAMATVRVDGRASAAPLQADLVPSSVVDLLAKAAGADARLVSLVPPDAARVTLDGRTLTVRLAVTADGAGVEATIPGLASVPVLRLQPGSPLTLRRVVVTGETVIIEGTLRLPLP